MNRQPYYAAASVDADRRPLQLACALPAGRLSAMLLRRPAGGCCCASPGGRRRRTIQTHQGPGSRRRETSRSRTQACSDFVIQVPELTGASNAPTPTRVNRVVRCGSTSPLRRLRQRQLSHCRGFRHETACHRCTAVSSRLRVSVQPNAHCVLGDQTRPRGCTRCTRLRRLIFARSFSAADWSASRRNQGTNCGQKKQFACRVPPSRH